jgi:uncharacterized protein YbjT (DUF2867 family)
VILVIGGRSKIGSALIDELSRRGEPVRALMRPREGDDGLPDSVDRATGDLADRESLSAALRDVDRVFLLCGPNEDEVQLNRNAIDAAREAGVQLLVRSSILGSDPASPATFVHHHGESDAYLKASGVPHVVLRPNLFQQNVTENTIPSIDEQGNFYANAADARISMVDTRDVAAVAAVLLLGEPAQDGAAHDITGPEAFSYHDVADKLSTSLKRPVTYNDAPDEAVREALLGFGVGDWMAGALVELYQDYKRSGVDGYAAQVTDTVERITGTPARALDDLLA